MRSVKCKERSVKCDVWSSSVTFGTARHSCTKHAGSKGETSLVAESKATFAPPVPASGYLLPSAVALFPQWFSAQDVPRGNEPCTFEGKTTRTHYILDVRYCGCLLCVCVCVWGDIETLKSVEPEIFVNSKSLGLLLATSGTNVPPCSLYCELLPASLSQIFLCDRKSMQSN